MPMINCYIDDRTLATLERLSAETGRDIVELAEAAISEAAIKAEVAARGPLGATPQFEN